jgi:hypothetical protein
VAMRLTNFLWYSAQVPICVTPLAHSSSFGARRRLPTSNSFGAVVECRAQLYAYCAHGTQSPQGFWFSATYMLTMSFQER